MSKTKRAKKFIGKSIKLHDNAAALEVVDVKYLTQEWLQQHPWVYTKPGLHFKCLKKNDSNFFIYQTKKLLEYFIEKQKIHHPGAQERIDELTKQINDIEGGFHFVRIKSRMRYEIVE